MNNIGNKKEEEHFYNPLCSPERLVSKKIISVREEEEDSSRLISREHVYDKYFPFLFFSDFIERLERYPAMKKEDLFQ